MDSIARPNITVPGAGKAATGPQQSAQDRLMAYIPLSISGVYPLLENGIAEYIKTPFKDVSPRSIEMAVFVLLLIWYALYLHKQYNQEAFKGRVRLKLQGWQTIVSIAAFVVWTYSIKSTIWADYYNAGIAIIVTVIFVLFAGLYVPSVTPAQAKGD